MPTDPITTLIDETRLLFHRLKVASEELHVDEEVSAGMRGVLFGLERQGPQTVPEMARARPVSRQHIQMLVNPLLHRRLVELVDNPRHRRSKLVQLTGNGRRLVERMRKREARLLGALGTGLSHERIESAAEVLRRIRERLADSG